MTKQIIIEDYSTQWPNDFEILKAVFADRLNNLITDIQHVGSTSVVGMSAKPVIDIDLIIDDRKKLNPIITELSTLGYDYAGDIGIEDREAFRRRSDLTPVDGSQRKWPAHNLYVCLNGSIALQNHLALRDFLRDHPDQVIEYSTLKKRLVAENPFDIDLYVKNKTPFITGILRLLGFDELALRSIRQANKAE